MLLEMSDKGSGGGVKGAEDAGRRKRIRRNRRTGFAKV